MTLSIGNFQKTQILSRAVAAKYARSVYDNKDLWKTTDLGTTFGLAYYKMLEGGWLHSYHLLARNYNEILRMVFPGLEQQLLKGFDKVLPSTRWFYPVVSRADALQQGWSKYGITIELDGLKESYIHMDYEGICAHQEYLTNPKTVAFSCVLPLVLPKDQGGLYVFEDRVLPYSITDEEYTQITQRNVKDATLINYTVGELVIFDSFLPHAIQPFEGERICVVIHFMLINEPVLHWEYWL